MLEFLRFWLRRRRYRRFMSKEDDSTLIETLKELVEVLPEDYMRTITRDEMRHYVINVNFNTAYDLTSHLNLVAKAVGAKRDMPVNNWVNGDPTKRRAVEWFKVDTEFTNNSYLDWWYKSVDVTIKAYNKYDYVSEKYRDRIFNPILYTLISVGILIGETNYENEQDNLRRI